MYPNRAHRDGGPEKAKDDCVAHVELVVEGTGVHDSCASSLVSTIYPKLVLRRLPCLGL